MSVVPAVRLAKLRSALASIEKFAGHKVPETEAEAVAMLRRITGMCSGNLDSHWAAMADQPL